MDTSNNIMQSVLPPIVEANKIKHKLRLMTFNDKSQPKIDDSTMIESNSDTEHDEQDIKYERKRKKNASGEKHEIPLVSLTKSLIHTYRTCRPGNFHYVKNLLNPRRVLTKDPQPGGNFGFDNRNGDMILVVGDIITNPSTGQKFKIIDMLGQGTFGQVVKCRTLNQVNPVNQPMDDPNQDATLPQSDKKKMTPAMVAIKVVKNRPAYTNQAKVEIKILEKLVRADEKSEQAKKHYHEHVVHMLDSFQYHAHMCIVFDLMSINLFEMIKQNDFRGLSIREIASFASQILAGMKVLSDLQIVHCDIKPENILIENFSNPPRVRIVDFGSACFENNTLYTYIQSRFYRAPEVIIGLPYSKSIDVWSFGCIMVELFMGLPVFPGVSNHNQLLRIEEMLGEFPEWMLESGKQVKKFYNKVTVVEREQVNSPAIEEDSSSSSSPFSIGTKKSGLKIQISRNRENSVGMASEDAVVVSTNKDGLDALLDEPVGSSGSGSKSMVSPREQKLKKKWMLKSAEEYAFDENLAAIEKMKRYCKEKTLHEIVFKCESKRRPKNEAPSDIDRNVLQSFLSFVKSLLVLDPKRRFTVDDAIAHPFISSPTMTDSLSPARRQSSLSMMSPHSPGLTSHGSFINSPFSPPARPMVPYPFAHDWTAEESFSSYNPFFKEAEDPRIGYDSLLNYPRINYLMGQSAYFNNEEVVDGSNYNPDDSYDMIPDPPALSLDNSSATQIESNPHPNVFPVLQKLGSMPAASLKRSSSDGTNHHEFAEMSIGGGKPFARGSTSELGTGVSASRCLFGGATASYPLIDSEKATVPNISSSIYDYSGACNPTPTKILNGRLGPSTFHSKSNSDVIRLNDGEFGSVHTRRETFSSLQSPNGSDLSRFDGSGLSSPMNRRSRLSGEFHPRLSFSGAIGQNSEMLPPPIDSFQRSYSFGSPNRRRTSAFSRVIPNGSGCYGSTLSPSGSPAHTRIKTTRADSVSSSTSDFSSVIDSPSAATTSLLYHRESQPNKRSNIEMREERNTDNNSNNSNSNNNNNKSSNVNAMETGYQTGMHSTDFKHPENTSVDCFLVTYIGNGETNMEVE